MLGVGVTGEACRTRSEKSVLDYGCFHASHLCFNLGGIDVCFANVHKRMGNLIEIVVLGGVWALMFIFRLYMLYRHPNVSKWRLVCWGAWGIIFLTAIFAFSIPSAIE